MPVTSFSRKVARKSAGSIDKEMKLQLATDQVARIVIIDPAPTYEWVHNLRKPVIGVNGKPLMVKITKNDEESWDHKMDFVGNPVCIGKLDTLETSGSDPENCPACRLASETEYTRPAERRFAVHVLKYKTKPGTSNLATPFNVDCKVWILSENRFTSLMSVLSAFEGEDGADPDARSIDLILGPCTNGQFQNYPIAAVATDPRCAWQTNAQTQQFAVETYQGSKVENLSDYCGRNTDERFIKQDCDDVVAAWEKVKQGGVEPPPLDTSDTLDNSLLDTPQTVPAQAPNQFIPSPAAAAPGQGSPLNEFRPGGSAQGLSTDVQLPAKPAAANGGAPSLEDLLSTLKGK